MSSSETQGQIVGARESLNGQKNMARRKVKDGKKSLCPLGLWGWGAVSLRIQWGERELYSQAKGLYSQLEGQDVLPSVSFIYFLCSAFTLCWYLSRAAEDGDGGSTDVSGRRTSTGSEAYSLLICLDATRFVWLDDLPKNLFKSTAEECKKSTSCWRSSLKNVVA